MSVEPMNVEEAVNIENPVNHEHGANQGEQVDIVVIEDNQDQETETESTCGAAANDYDSNDACPICMDNWTNSGEHRLCCLRCGHLFGHSCILRWLQTSCNSTNRRCPQCNKKAALKDIRMLYAKNITTVDTSELEILKDQIKSLTVEKDELNLELSKYFLREKLYEQQISTFKLRIQELENQTADICSNQTIAKPKNTKFHLQQAIEICKDGGCRVLDYNMWFKHLIVSQKSTNSLFPGFGIKKVDMESFQTTQFITLHTRAIRDITFHSMQQSLLLSVGFDKCAKLMDIQNNIIAHSYQTENPLWSCCWSAENANCFFVGTQKGSVVQFDIRQTSEAVSILESPVDRSPVVSLATVPANPGSGVSRGGFIACRLTTCYAYEQTESTYSPKLMHLEGPFVSVRYDEKNKHALISCRPNARQPLARHIVCTIEKGTRESVLCNIVHTFHAGNTQQLLSRPRYMQIQNDTFVAAHQESSSCVAIWSVSTGRQSYNISASDPVLDLCGVETDNNLYLATLSAKKVRFYAHSQV